MNTVARGRQVGEPLRETRPEKGHRYLGDSDRASQLFGVLFREGVELKGNGIVSAEVQRLVLMQLAYHCNQESVTWVGQRRMAEALKLSRWSIADALEALEAQGVIERQQTKKGASARYLVMPSVPIVAGVPLPVVVPIPTELAREWTGSGQVVAGVPLPERERETENPPSNFSQSDQAGKKGRLKELVRACVEQDLSNRPPAEPVGDALKRKLAKTYEPIVSAALEEYPSATGSDLVSYCVTKRRGEPVSRALVTALKGNQAQECQQCNGGVTFETEIDSEGVSRTRVVPCSSCT